MQKLQQQSDQIPKETLYINNLNEKIKPDDMKYALFFLFSQFGEIVEIIAKKSNMMRGQAFVIFRDTTSATNAKHQLSGFNLFDKQIRISFAKVRSEIIEKMEGSWIPKKKKKKNVDNVYNKDQNKNNQIGEDDQANLNEEEKSQIKQQQQFQQLQAQTQQQQQYQQMQQLQINEPNNVLFIDQLHQAITQDMLQTLFKQFPGFAEVRIIVNKHIAFVEFDQEDQATVALRGLQNFKMGPDIYLRISYAKKY